MSAPLAPRSSLRAALTLLVPGLAAAALLLPARPVLAAKPVIPAGQKPPDPEPVKEPEPTPAPAAAETPAEPVKAPVGTAATVPDAGVFVVPDEIRKQLEVAPKVAQKIIENPAEVVFKTRNADFAFTLRVRPGLPKPGEVVELRLDVQRIHEPPDPVQGDREAYNEAQLSAVFSRDGAGGRPYLFHKLPLPGEYGLHVLPTDQGVHELAIGRRSGKPGMDINFKVGVGVPHPLRPDDALATVAAGSRGPVRPTAAGAAGGPPLAQVMEQLGERLLAYEAALEAGRAADGVAAAKAMQELSGQVAGKVPGHHARRTQEFEGNAQRLAAGLTELASRPLEKPADRVAAKAKLLELESATCMRCHVQFRFDVADDTSTWPKFTAASAER